MSKSPRTDQMDARSLPSEVGDLPEYIYQHIRPILGEWSALCRDIETTATDLAVTSAKWEVLAKENLSARGRDAMRFMKEITEWKAKCEGKEPIYYGDISPRKVWVRSDGLTWIDRRTATGPRRLVYIDCLEPQARARGCRFKRGTMNPNHVPDKPGQFGFGRRKGDYEAWQALSTKCPTFIANGKTVRPTKGASFEDFAAPGVYVFSDRRVGVVSRRQFKSGTDRPRRREIKVQETNGRGRRSTDRVPYWDLPKNRRTGVVQRRLGHLWGNKLSRRDLSVAGRRKGDPRWMDLPAICRRTAQIERRIGLPEWKQGINWYSFARRTTSRFTVRGDDRRKS